MEACMGTESLHMQLGTYIHTSIYIREHNQSARKGGLHFSFFLTGTDL
jgi:hypothetical protein